MLDLQGFVKETKTTVDGVTHSAPLSPLDRVRIYPRESGALVCLVAWRKVKWTIVVPSDHAISVEATRKYLEESYPDGASMTEIGRAVRRYLLPMFGGKSSDLIESKDPF